MIFNIPNISNVSSFSPSGLRSFVKVTLKVLDINDNEPEMTVDDIFVCENDMERECYDHLLSVISLTDVVKHRSDRIFITNLRVYM